MLSKIKWVKNKFRCNCSRCGCVIDAGGSVLWHSKLKEAMCLQCGEAFFRWIERGKA